MTSYSGGTRLSAEECGVVQCCTVVVKSFNFHLGDKLTLNL